MFEKELQDIGLNEKEAKVYLSLLKFDHASVIDISKDTKINRTTVYTIITSLEEKGLVSETTLDKKVHYQAESLERLQTFVEKQKNDFEEKAHRVPDIISQLKILRKNEGSRPTVRYFEGKKGIISAHIALYDGKVDGTPMYIIYSKDRLNKLFNEEELKEFRLLRTKNKIKSKVIYTWREGHLPSDKQGDRLQIDSQKYPISSEISVYGDVTRINISKKDNLSAIIINSKEFSDTLKTLFNLAFDKNK